MPLDELKFEIYNSRNYSILLNGLTGEILTKSTTVEIILYYLTHDCVFACCHYLQQ